MIDVFSDYATDEAAEAEGVWKDLGKGTKLLLARTQNRNYTALLSRLYKQHQEVLDSTNPDDSESDEALAKSDEIMVEVFAKTILLGWEKLAYKGQPLDYSLEAAKTLLKHKEFRLMVARKASEVDGYRAKLEDNQGKA